VALGTSHKTRVRHDCHFGIWPERIGIAKVCNPMREYRAETHQRKQMSEDPN